MFTADSVQTSILTLLDDEGSDRYSFDQDIKPSINLAIDSLTALCTYMLDKRILQEEVLSDLLKVKMYEVEKSSYMVGTGYIDITSDYQTIWRIVGIDPLPNTSGAADYYYGESKKRFAKRLTLQEWSDGYDNPFKSGSVVSSLPSGVQEVGYILHWGADTEETAGNRYIHIRPWNLFSDSVSEKSVAMWYLKNPTYVTITGDNIEFPQSVFPWVVQKTLSFIKMKQSSQPASFTVNDKEINELTQLLNA